MTERKRVTITFDVAGHKDDDEVKRIGQRALVAVQKALATQVMGRSTARVTKPTGTVAPVRTKEGAS